MHPPSHKYIAKLYIHVARCSGLITGCYAGTRTAQLSLPQSGIYTSIGWAVNFGLHAQIRHGISLSRVYTSWHDEKGHARVPTSTLASGLLPALSRHACVPELGFVPEFGVDKTQQK